MKTFVRDSTVTCTVTFLGTNGLPVAPDSATLTLSYLIDGTETETDYVLVQSGDEWSYDWDSRVADPGQISGHAQTDGVAPVSSVDFEFRLSANKANRDQSDD